MVYRILSRIYPKNIRKGYTELLNYLGIKVNADVYIGFTLLIGFLLGMAGAFIIGTFYTAIPFFILFPAIFILTEILIYVPLMLKVDKNARVVEDMLPDAIQLMSSNLKSGLTVDQALLASSRPEFGIFEDELNRIGKEVATGKPIGDALLDSSKRIKSEKYKKTMELLYSGLRSGGELAKLLDQTSANLKHQKLVDQKVRSNVMMYVIFIFSAICFGAPILFGLSSFLVEVMSNIFGQIDIPAASTQRFSIPLMSFGENAISQGFILTYIISSIAMSSVMGGLIVGLISKGKEKYGLKYIPMIFASAMIVFFIIKLIVSKLIGGIMNL
ncbi:hypothetical protein HOG16_04935 [Candidatus Woesearchaeota archaeon]|jgi:archaeal flagellar protein FlaJ|nr:hypothetical protein [Candidatus Woesearchaeota archaeon]MBT4321754.1 hypothetical protein [Candidatus Woesearchaeota archaeon]MBT4631154.1 hypothetical protein [Candidatus Woesearchaeota archaeon]